MSTRSLAYFPCFVHFTESPQFDITNIGKKVRRQNGQRGFIHRAETHKIIYPSRACLDHQTAIRTRQIAKHSPNTSRHAYSFRRSEQPGVHQDNSSKLPHCSITSLNELRHFLFTSQQRYFIEFLWTGNTLPRSI